jgi:hypothetical protein
MQQKLRHGSSDRLQIGRVDADTGEFIAAELTSKDVDDGSQVGPLLEQIVGPVASFTGDGAYDRDDVYREVCQRHPDAAVIVPPRLSAVPSATAETAPTKACARTLARLRLERLIVSGQRYPRLFAAGPEMHSRAQP